MNPFRSVLLLLALLASACHVPAQQALKVDPDTGQLVEPTTLQIGANQTFTVAANATITLPDNALTIADTAGLQIALDERLVSDNGTLTLGNATTQGILRLSDPNNTGNLTLSADYGSLLLGFKTLAGDQRTVEIFASSVEGLKSYYLPDSNGQFALSSDLTNFQKMAVEKTANFTAENRGSYITTATLTITDPSPTQAAEYAVIVRSGTTTIGGVAYSTAGTALRRIYNGAWATYPYFSTTAPPLTGNVTVAQGGTGQTTLTAGSLLTGNGTGPLTLIAPGTSGNVLTSNGTAWLSSAPTGGGGNITINTSSPLTVNGGNSSTTSNATLAVGNATTSAVGVVQLATDAQAMQLTSNTTVISPAQAFNASAGMMRIDLNLGHPNTSTAVGGNGTSTFANFDGSINTVGGGTSFARRSLANRLVVSGDGGAVNFDKPIGFQIIFEARQVTTNGYFRFTLTGGTIDTDAVASVARPTQKAIGIYIVNGVVWGVVHNGTTRTETSLGLSVNVLNASPFGRGNNITCLRVGSGVYQFWVNGVSGGTISGGPTGLSSTQWSSDYLGWHIAVSSGGDAGATNYIVRQAHLLQAQ